MNKWAIDEVCHFLAENEFEEEVIEVFRTNKIKGRVLAMLSDEDLRHLGVAALGDRKYLLHIFKSYKETAKSDDLSNTASSDISNVSSDIDISNAINEDHLYNEDEFERTEHDTSGYDNDTPKIVECLGSSRDLTMSAPSKSHTRTVMKTKGDAPVIVISDEETKEIPDPFPFPATYSANVDVALRKGNLCPATTAHFYTRIAGIMSIYTRQPTKEQYSRVAQAVLRKYPFIRNPVNPEGTIITKLRGRFREMRRYTGDPVDKPTIVKKINDKGMPPTKKIKMEDGKYKIPEGEDNASFARHNSLLKSEAKKSKPNRCIVSELMGISFAMRRNNITMEPKPLRELLNCYPFLKDRDEMIAELSRLNHQNDIRATYLCVWNKQWLPKIVTMIKENTTDLNKNRMKSVLDVDTDLVDDNDGILTIKVLFAMTYMLKDHKTKPISDKLMTITPATVDLEKAVSDMNEAAPTLLVIGHLNNIQQVFLIAENQILCNVKPVESPLSLLSAFYSFNMNYPKGLESLYCFLEYAILNKKPYKMSSCLSVFITYLNNIKA